MSTFLRKILLGWKFSDSVASYDAMIETESGDEDQIYFDIDSPEIENLKRFRLFPDFLKTTTLAL